MTSYNKEVVKSLTLEQFLDQYPGKEADYYSIVGQSDGKVLRKVTAGYLKANPSLIDEGVKEGDMYPM